MTDTSTLVAELRAYAGDLRRLEWWDEDNRAAANADAAADRLEAQASEIERLREALNVIAAGRPDAIGHARTALAGGARD